MGKYYKDLESCHQRIEQYIHRTPVMSSTLLNEMAGCHLYFKCENFQKGGAYKMRGALNAILQLTDEQKAKGVTTHSSGNFAQAVTLAARSLNIPAYIVMPSSAPSVKVAAVKGYGGNVIICGPTLKDREAMSDKIISETGATFLHPSNDLNVIIGQGTAAYELLQDHPDLDAIITPVGGGGLIAGTCIAADGKQDVYGGEPYAVDDAYRSLKSGKIESNETTDTIADGLKTQLGDINFPIIRECVKEIIRVTEEEIVDAMKLVWERMKIIIEPSSAVTFAACLSSKETFKNKKVGIIISGGNVDLSQLPF
ncbi:MAG: pyridoxal-phosphate dependent enzyme [Saprospiraceae bacterium]|nr:pyridoxal-phosphate dependent enzyme [Saprospiraceae bacterium]